MQIMGPNIEAGETLQLLVGSNVWKKSKLLDEDIAAASRSPLAHSCMTDCLVWCGRQGPDVGEPHRMSYHRGRLPRLCLAGPPVPRPHGARGDVGWQERLGGVGAVLEERALKANIDSLNLWRFQQSAD